MKISNRVAAALRKNQPVVALESTVITHGLPYPENLKLALDMENMVRQNGAEPATIGVLAGKITVGLTSDQIGQIATSRDLVKISTRDIAPAVTQSLSGGTTVAASLLLAHLAGIRVFATGGIGGVHRSMHASFSHDISNDMQALARYPLIVVCAGAKAILDLRATLEMLETYGVPVVGYQTNEFPAFYSRESGLQTSTRADTSKEVVEIAQTHWSLGIDSAILVTIQPPAESAIPRQTIEQAIDIALVEAKKRDIHGQQVTPFLLERISAVTEGASLKTNLDLLLNNAGLAAQIANEWVKHKT